MPQSTEQLCKWVNNTHICQNLGYTGCQFTSNQENLRSHFLF